MIAVIVGTRPEIIKMAPLVWALQDAGRMHMVVDLGQHSLDAMSKDVFTQMGYHPHLQLAKYSFGTAVDWLRDRIRGVRMAVVQGDTWTCVAGAIAALHEQVPLAHLEAGLRSGDPVMVEERNRMMVDDTAELLLTYDDMHTAYLEQLLAHGWGGRGKIVQVGNPLVDVIARFSKELRDPPLDLLAQTRQHAARNRPYAYVTLHRPELSSHHDRLRVAIEAIAESMNDGDMQVLFPMHPRTADMLSRHQIPMPEWLDGGVVAPLPPLQSLRAIKHAAVVVTDSGGVQEEACLFGTRCVTVRENTERPETLDAGNDLTGFDKDSIKEGIAFAFGDAGVNDRRRRRVVARKVYGSPGVGQRILVACEGCHG